MGQSKQAKTCEIEQNEENLNREIAWYLGRDSIIEPSDFDRALQAENDIGKE